MVPSLGCRLWLDLCAPDAFYLALKHLLDETNPTHLEVLNDIKRHFREETTTRKSIATVIHAHPELVQYVTLRLCFCVNSHKPSSCPQTRYASSLDVQPSRQASRRLCIGKAPISVSKRTLLVNAAGLPLPCGLSHYPPLYHPFSSELAGAPSPALQCCDVEMLAIVS